MGPFSEGSGLLEPAEKKQQVPPLRYTPDSILEGHGFSR